MFQVVENPIRVMWFPIDYTSAVTLYAGQLVYAGFYNNSATPTNTLSGLDYLGAASGNADTARMRVPWGVVLGFNHFNNQYSATYQADYDTSVNTQALLLARDFRFNGGMYAPTEPMVLAQVAVIGPNTILKGNIFKTSLGTAPNVCTVTAGGVSTTGLGYTVSSTVGFTPVSLAATSYCRKGANAGLYRITNDVSTTVKTVLIPYPYDIAAGDQFVNVPVKMCGTTQVLFDSLSMFIDGAATVSSNYYLLDVLDLDLKTAGAETATFKFNVCHFDAVRV